MIINEKDLGTFLADAPLYSKVEFYHESRSDADFSVFDFLSEKGFKTYCLICKDHHTFKIQKIWGSQFNIRNTKFDADSYQKDGTYSFCFKAVGNCQFCGFAIDFLLNVFTTAPQVNDIWPMFYLRKAGQLPAIARKPENDIYNYLDSEDKDFYGKALSSLSHGYGIGSFAYFRRIVENEIKRIVFDLSELDFENAPKIKAAFLKFEKDHQMANLLDSIYPLLPASLRDMSQNPLKVLYQQISEGIHETSEEDCLQKAQHIDKLLQFVIKKVNLMKQEYKEVRAALKALGK